MNTTREDLLAVLTVILIFLGLLVSTIFLWITIILIVIQIGLYHWDE